MEEPPGESPAVVAATEADEDLGTESQEAEEPEILAEAEAVPAPASSAICVQAGWFKGLADATEAAEWMRSAGAEAVEIRHEEQQIIRNYQVYLPPAESREAARAMASELRDRGVEDIWIINQGAQANGISLGVYRNKGYMGRRVAELEKLGYGVVTSANMRTVTEFAVESRTGGDAAAFEDAWNAKFQGYAIRRVDCADRT